MAVIVTPVVAAVLISAAGFFLSLISTVIIAGLYLGRILAKMDFMNDRLAKIEGMFILQPKAKQSD